MGEFLVAISSHLKQATPKGTIVFSGYEKYIEFIGFCRLRHLGWSILQAMLTEGI